MTPAPAAPRSDAYELPALMRHLAEGLWPLPALMDHLLDRAEGTR
jgi:hypothetical protein